MSPVPEQRVDVGKVAILRWAPIPSLLVRRFRVIDLYTKAVATGCGIVALEEVQLLMADAQPAYRAGEA
jgi:hypothetical protein